MALAAGKLESGCRGGAWEDVRKVNVRRDFNDVGCGVRLLASFSGASVIRLVIEGFLDHSRQVGGQTIASAEVGRSVQLCRLYR